MRWLLTILIAMIPTTAWSGSFNSADLRMVADAVCWEARGESFQDQIDVAYVIRNRVADPAFPKNVRAVLLAPNQFSGFRGEFRAGECRRQSPAWRTALKAVSVAFLTDRFNHRATHFAVCRLGRPFGPKFTLVKRNASHCYWRRNAS